MKRFFREIEDALADAALAEEGVDIAAEIRTSRPLHETFEELFMEIAFAEAGDFDEIREAILKEHEREQDRARPDDCQYGDNDLCYV